MIASSPASTPPPPYSAMPLTNSFGDRLPVHRPHSHLLQTKGGFSSGASSPNPSAASPGCESEPDIFNLPPASALILLARSVEVLVSLSDSGSAIANNAPPTPPHSAPSTPELVASGNVYPGSQTSLPSPPSAPLSGFNFGSPPESDIDGVWLKNRTPLEDKTFSQCGNQAMKYESITKKFYAKVAPPVSIEEYLFRIHRFCPLSTAVYLAAAVYIHRIAIVDRSMPVTRLNVHRLLLAALRIANKSLEDMVQSHARFAKVGGLSETELARLEVNFCFLVDFDVSVDEAKLEKQLALLRETVQRQAELGTPAILRTGTMPVKIPAQRRGGRYGGPVMLDV